MNSDVIMYVVPLCPYCRKAKRFLKIHGVSFQERNILVNRKYRQEFEQLTDVMTVPVTTFGQAVVIGYDESAFQQALNGLGGAEE